MCHHNEELFQIWTGMDLSVRNWHEEFDEFCCKHWKISKMCTLRVTPATKWWLLQICYLRHRLRIFLFCRKIMFRYHDIQVFVYLTIPWLIIFTTSRWVLVHETRCIFEYVFWATTRKVTKFGQLIDISKSNNFQ